MEKQKEEDNKENADDNTKKVEDKDINIKREADEVVVYQNYVFSINLLSQEILQKYANSLTGEEFCESIVNPYFRFPQDEDLEV